MCVFFSERKIAGIDIKRSFSAMPNLATIRIGLFLYPQCMPAGLFAFSDLLHAANRLGGASLFDPVFVAVRPRAIECAHGQWLTAAESLHEAKLDAILIPGFWAESPRQVFNELSKNTDEIAAIANLPKSVKLLSYCTGVCLLASAKQLNGQKATVTWWLANAMRQHHSKIIWQIERTSIDTPRAATASGVNGYLPIAQTLIEKVLSVEAYRALTKLMVLPRPEVTHQAFQMINLIEQSDSLLRKLHTLVEQTAAYEVTVRRLADDLGTSERTLARKVMAATGLSVASYVRRIKLNQVSERLILTSLPASTISVELGFASDSSMRRMFKELTALTPTEYRQSFGRC